MSGWVSVRPGRPAAPADPPTGREPGLAGEDATTSPTPPPPRQAPAPLPARPVLPRPELSRCPSCAGTGVCQVPATRTWTGPHSAGMVIGGTTVTGPCPRCAGLGWVMPAGPVSPVGAPAVPWWHPAPYLPTITC